MNLILNASEAIEPEDGIIQLTTGASRLDETELERFTRGAPLVPGTYVYLRVYDNGHGMSPETRERIFDSFFTTKPGGHGLGLAATAWIVRQHGGGLHVDTAPGAGTLVELVFPVAERSSELRREAPRANLGTILLVDDEEVVRETAGRMLGSAGYRVLTACDGVEGYDVFRRHRDEVALVLLDLTMPGGGGSGASRRMRSLRPDLPIILISGYEEDHVAAHFTDGEPAGFVHKPFLPQTLIGTVQRVLAEAERAEPA